MALGDYRILPGLVTEEIGQEILVCDTDLAVVHRVSGPAADVLRQVLATGGGPAALESDDITSGLVAAGVLVAADAPADLVSRRSFVSAAAAVGAMGIVTLALPRAAAASSVVDPSLVPPSPPPDPVVASANTQIQYPASVGTFSQGVAGENVQVRWTEVSGETSFNFQVTIRPLFGNSFETIVSSAIQSGDSYTTFYVPGLKVGDFLEVLFVTVGLISNVTGEERIARRQS